MELKGAAPAVWTHLSPVEWLAGMFAILLLAPMLFALGILTDGLVDDVRHSDVGVIFGSQVDRDGQPSARLRARLDRGLALYHDGSITHLLVSGGIGQEGYDEATVMRNYLNAHGIPLDRILVDHHGDTTDATAGNAARMMRSRGMRRAIVVTQFFHVPRARMALASRGMQTPGSAHAFFLELRDVYSMFREEAALVTYWLHINRSAGTFAESPRTTEHAGRPDKLPA